MPPEQDPTQSAQAPGDGITPNNQADPPGDKGASSEGEGGKTYTQEQMDRVKASAEGSKQEAERLAREGETLRNNNEMLMSQQNTAQLQPAPVVSPTYNPETFLTTEEEVARTKAFEDLDSTEIGRLDRLANGRQNQASQATFVQALGTVASRNQTINSVNSELDDAKEFQDPAVKQQLILQAVTSGRNPVEAAKYVDGQRNVDGIIVNPLILLDKLKDYRIQHGSAVKAAGAGPENHDSMGNEGPGSAMPSGGKTTFDSGIHLTASERSGALKGMTLKGMPTSGMSDASEAYKKIWSGLTEEVRAYRMEHGAPHQSPEGQTSGKSSATIWTAGKKS